MKGRWSATLHVIRRSERVLTIDCSLILEGLTKVVQRQVSKRINDRIAQLLGFVEDIPMSPQEYEKIQKELEDLERQRREYRILRKVRYAMIHAALHRLWLDRVQGVSRSLARLTFDPMSITMPIPPTNESANSSLGRGRIINGYAC